MNKIFLSLLLLFSTYKTSPSVHPKKSLLDHKIYITPAYKTYADQQLKHYFPHFISVMKPVLYNPGEYVSLVSFCEHLKVILLTYYKAPSAECDKKYKLAYNLILTFLFGELYPTALEVLKSSDLYNPPTPILIERAMGSVYRKGCPLPLSVVPKPFLIDVNIKANKSAAKPY